MSAPIYVEYKNLSSIVSQAEHQKDIITSVIKKIEGQTKLILEYSLKGGSPQAQSIPDFFWEAKCIVCYSTLEDNNGVVLSSVKKIPKNNGENVDIYFDTIDLPGRISSWKIELAEVKPIVVQSGKTVKISFNSGNGISIQSFGKSLKNAMQGDIIRVQVNDWFNKNKNWNSTSNEIIEAKVVAPNEVEYVDKQ